MGTTAKRWAVEAKVIAATCMSTGVGVAVAVLNDVEADHQMLGGLPAWAQALVLVVVPPVATFLAGYQAKHTPRA